MEMLHISFILVNFEGINHDNVLFIYLLEMNAQ